MSQPRGSVHRGEVRSEIAPSRRDGGGVPGRHTVTIRGQGAERRVPRTGAGTSGSERRRSPRAHERLGFRPDKVAMWAVLLGVMLVLAAATSSHAAIHVPPAAHSAHALAALGR
jgi:hypothetical protein